jgi:hypothetical protein
MYCSIRVYLTGIKSSPNLFWNDLFSEKKSAEVKSIKKMLHVQCIHNLSLRRLRTIEFKFLNGLWRMMLKRDLWIYAGWIDKNLMGSLPEFPDEVSLMK